MKRRVLLIDPPLYKHRLWDPIRTSQPLGIWSIGSYLQSHGHEVQLLCAPLQDLGRIHLIEQGGASPASTFVDERIGILDILSADELLERWGSGESCLRIGMSEQAILAAIEEFSPDLVGISSIATCLHQSVVDLSVAIRARYPELPVIAGGQHATAMPAELLRSSHGSIDFVVVGEGEEVTRQVLAALHDRESIRALPGIAYLGDEGDLVLNHRPRPLDQQVLPPLDPSLLEHVLLPEVPAHTYSAGTRKCTDMMFSVGCHRACPYCFSPVMRGRLRTRSWGQIGAQLRLVRDHGFGEVVLQDDDLLKDRDFFIGLLRLIARAGLRWQDNGGMELELLDDGLVREIIRSGCTAIYIPVNPRQLADRLPTEEAVAHVHYLRQLREAGIYTYTSGIYGVPNLEHPSKTYDDLRSLRDFHLNLVAGGHVDASLVFPLSALPGTKWFREIEGNPAFDFDHDNWLGYSVFVPQVYPRELGRATLCREIVDTHGALNELQASYPWFSPFPNQASSAVRRPGVADRASGATA